MLKKILKIVGILFVLALVSLIAFSIWLTSSNNSYKGNNKEILSSNLQSYKKALVIYQPSKSDISSDVAHNIAKGLNKVGYEVTINYPQKHVSKDIKKYSVIVFGSPVYFGNPSTALTSYMSKIKDFSSSKVLLYTTGGSKDSSDLKILKKHLHGNKPYKAIKFTTDAKDNNRKAYELGKELSSND